MTNWLNIFKHLLPHGKAWNLTPNKTLRQFFDGLKELPVDVEEFADLVYLDMFPETTRELDSWDQQFGLPDTGLSDDDRRDRLAAAWAACGGQSPSYIQGVLHDNGFDDVYIHEWWVPASSPPVARNPLNWLIGIACECDEDLAECGEAGAACGERTPVGEYPSWLVNKLDIARSNTTVECGEADAECGEADAECGEYDGFIIERKIYTIPDDPDYWPYFLYFGGSTFGESAIVLDDRRDEFENLLLKLCPAQQWIGLFINYSGLIVEDETSELLLDDDSGGYLGE